MPEPQKILVLGVGNILYTDEGLGVRTVERMMEEYDFSDNVTLMDGGTLGTKLMDPIQSCDLLLVIDAVLVGDEPGSVYRLTGDDLRKSLGFINSMHDTDLVDTLIICDMTGHRPDAVVIGVEPQDYKSMGVELSPVIAERLPAVIDIVLKEIEQAGGSWTKKAAA